MLDAYASTGLPVGYPHWSFGKSFIAHDHAYRKGARGLAYEIVINSDPCIAYLMEENSMPLQALVIAHACYGHNSFFKGNYLFRQWTSADAIIDYMVFARQYVMQCEERHGGDHHRGRQEADAVIVRLSCPLCLGNHRLRDCPLKHGDHATEADVLLSQTASHPGPDCSCPDCTRAAERLIIDAFMTRLRFDAGVLCSFCGDDHADSAGPQKRPLLAPRVCGNCGGQHSIQQCSDIQRLLFAA